MVLSNLSMIYKDSLTYINFQDGLSYAEDKDEENLLFCRKLIR